MNDRTDAGELVVALHATPAAGPALVGTKALTLGRLTRTGLAVPEGLVLTTRAAELVMSQAAPGSDAAPEEVLGAGLPAPVEESIAAIAAHFGEATLAVRSSAVNEDGAAASFAGQYETVLHVRGLEELRAAVRRCWASAYGERVRSYAGARYGASIAVLVQRQVDADVAGVAFTANPVTGATDEVLVSAVTGLAEDLVAGKQTPDEWVVKGQSTTVLRATHGVLAEPQVRAVAALAKQAEELLGRPQDVEWAMAGGRLLVLQSRPVTWLPTPPTVELPPGTWAKDAEHYAEPFTAFGASICADLISSGLTSMFERFGATLERMDVRSIGGEVYLRPVPIGGRDGPAPPWWVVAALARLAPPLRRRMRTARKMVRPEVFRSMKHDWETVERPHLRDEASRLRSVDLGALSPAELQAHLEAAVALLRRGLHLHFQLIPPYAVTLHGLVELCRDRLGWSEAEAIALVAGTSSESSAPVAALGEIAARAAGIPGAREAIAGAGVDLPARLAKVDPDLGAAFERWCDDYAFRCVHDDPGSPLWLERPWMLSRMLADLVAEHSASATPFGERVALARQDARDRALSQLANDPAARARFERALSDAAAYYPLREDSAIWGASVPAGVVRLALLEAGRRLHMAGHLDRPDDVVHLDQATLTSALAGRAPETARATATRSRAERAWVKQHPGPPLYGSPPSPPPDLRGLPEAARRLNRALLWGQPSPARSAANDSGDSGDQLALSGAAGSPGSYTGPARIVREDADFALLRRGDVLVAATTDPAWSLLFGIAGALVTDQGGLLAHAAIVAREHGIPAVVGTGEATRLIRNGDLVHVSGSDGRVRWTRSA